MLDLNVVWKQGSPGKVNKTVNTSSKVSMLKQGNMYLKGRISWGQTWSQSCLKDHKFNQETQQYDLNICSGEFSFSLELIIHPFSSLPSFNINLNKKVSALPKINTKAF